MELCETGTCHNEKDCFKNFWFFEMEVSPILMEFSALMSAVSHYQILAFLSAHLNGNQEQCEHANMGIVYMYVADNWKCC